MISYLDTCVALSKEIENNYEMIIKRNHLEKKPAPPTVINPNWPPEICSFYQTLNGLEIRWQPVSHPEDPGWSGWVRLLSAQEVNADGKGLVWFDHTPADSPLRSFRLVDFFIDEAAVGFYDTAESKGELHLYLFEGSPEPLGVNLDGYIQLLRTARGFFYWQKALLAIKNGKDNTESRNFKERMPQLFPDFSTDAFVHQYQSLQIMQ